MKVLLLVHTDLIPPKIEDEEKVDWATVPWATEYDVITCLEKSGHRVRVLGITDNLIDIRKTIEEFKPSIVFNLLEEYNGEAIFDQNVVSYLELLGVPYSGCNPKGLILSRDKALSKKILRYHKIRSARFQVIPRNRPKVKIQFKEFPVIVKCLNEEASRGLSQASIVNSPQALTERAEFIHRSFNVDAIAEEFIEGREFYVGLLGNYRLKVFHPWELRFTNAQDPQKEFYSENAKFDKNYRQRKGIETGKADIDSELLHKLQTLAKKTYKTLGLSGYARIDIRVNKAGECFVLEANPNPDISEFDDFASSALDAGIEYPELLNRIMKLGKKWSPIKGH